VQKQRCTLHAKRSQQEKIGLLVEKTGTFDGLVTARIAKQLSNFGGFHARVVDFNHRLCD
jgi:hypothetical protein